MLVCAAAAAGTSTPHVHRDGDVATARAGERCSGASLPEPYRAAAHGLDCDDADPGLHRWVVLYPDSDGDGVGAPPRRIACVGGSFPVGWSALGWDIDDLDARVQVESDPANIAQLVLF